MYILTLEKVASGSEQFTYVYQVGEHVIGRGPELQCASKKVSRKHALLKVTQNDGVFLESTHNNPCYHKSKETQTIQIVSFSKSIKLNNEDKIALALEHGWFTAKISKSNEEVLPADSVNNKRELLDNNEANEAKKIKLNDDTAENDANSELQLQIDEVNDAPELQNDTVEAEVPVINDAVEAEVPVINDAVESEVVDKNEQNISNTEIKQEPLDESINQPEIPELPEVKQEPADTSIEMAIKDEPEDETKNTVNQDNSNDPTSASTSLGNGSSRRDRCWYGSSCYRKNPTHRATFSHPNDTDYDSDPNDTRAICCYGVNCYRRNKLHREKYRHPNQDKIPKPPSKKKSKGGNHFHIHFRSHQRSPNLFVRRVRIPSSNNHRYIVIDFNASHPFDNFILDEDLDLFDAPSDHSDSDYFSGPDI